MCSVLSVQDALLVTFPVRGLHAADRTPDVPPTRAWRGHVPVPSGAETGAESRTSVRADGVGQSPSGASEPRACQRMRGSAERMPMRGALFSPRGEGSTGAGHDACEARGVFLREENRPQRDTYCTVPRPRGAGSGAHRDGGAPGRGESDVRWRFVGTEFQPGEVKPPEHGWRRRRPTV